MNNCVFNEVISSDGTWHIADHECKYLILLKVCKYLILLKVQGLLVIKEYLEVFSIVIVLFTTYNSKYVTYENVGDFLDEKREF
jgi:hypothetical protein